MLYVQHWSFKTGYHQKGAEKFLGGGGDYPGVEIIGRYHAPGSLEGWIVLKTDDPKAILLFPPIAFALTFLKINTDKSLIDLLGFVAMGCLLVSGGVFLNYLLSKGK